MNIRRRSTSTLKTRRSRAFWIIAMPMAIWLGVHDARVAAQQAATESGVDLAAMDKTAAPCNDFYQYACGGWIAQHPAPPDQPRYGRFEDLQERNNAILKDILEDAAKNTTATDPNIRKIGDYYASCMDERTIDAKGLAPLKPDLDRVDAITSLAQLPGVVGHLQTTGVAPFFGFGAAPDFKDASQYMLIYGQGGLGLPDRDYYLKDDPSTTQIRDAYVQHVSKMLQLSGIPSTRAAEAASSILKIETALAKASLDRVSRRNPTNIYHKMPMSEVRKLVPSFNMSAFLETAEAPRADSANVTETEYMKGVEQVLSTTPLPDLKMYMRWHVLHGNSAALATPFEEENFGFYGRTLTGAKAQKPRWKRCVEAVDSDLGEALGKAYVDRTFGPEGKDRTVRLVQAIEAALGQDISDITWMSDTTKRQAELKLRAVANKVGYPDRWRDYSSLRIVRGDELGNSQRANLFAYRRQLAKIGKPVDKTEWGMTPPTVNAYYNPFENNINFPAGILQPPFFNKSADDAVNFGAAAAVVGHELTHGFDDQGRRFDADGNLRDWWTPEDGKAFEERAACVADQYSGYTTVDDVKLNGRLTLGENVADNGGLRLAWMALMEDLKEKHLGEADGFSPEQRFFIGWAQMWCESRTPEVARLRAKTDPHSPGRFRTIGVVSNMPEFQKAFGCQANAPMVSQKICRVW